ncbi:hypothetical protein SATMO3_57790 [Sporomusa aerivorans]
MLYVKKRRKTSEKVGKVGTVWAEGGQAQSLINPGFLIRKYSDAHLPTSILPPIRACVHTHARRARMCRKKRWAGWAGGHNVCEAL